MAKGTPAEIAARWASRTSAASGDWVAGVNRVTEAPGARAAAKADKWLMAVQESKAKFAANVGAVTLADWKAATAASSGRLSEGVTRKQGKMQAFMTDFLPFVSQVQATVAAMPDDTFEQRLQRMMANARGLRAYKRR